MNLSLVPLSTENLNEALELAVEVFGESDRESISAVYNKSLGLIPETAYTACEQVTRRNYFLALLDGVPAGVTGYYSFENHEDDAWLGWLAVSPNFQKRGLGTLLTEASFDAAVKAGVKNFRIWTTLEEEYDSARRLYNRLGYVQEAYRENAQDAAKLVVIFSRSANPMSAHDHTWKASPYKIDCENYEIPRLNRELGL